MKELYDVHCHILPGIDDGAKDIEVSKQMLQKLYEDGVRNLIVTPHYRRGYYTPKKSAVDAALQELQRFAGTLPEKFRIYPGCEVYHTSHTLERLRDQQVYTMANSFYVLTEFLPGDDFRKIQGALYEMKCEGYLPILAHAERSECLYRNIDYIEELANMGIKIQINAGSIAGRQGLGMKWYCKKLMKRNLIHLVGTDAHDMEKRPPEMDVCQKVMTKTMGEDYTRRILISNPKKIITNEVM